MAVTRGLAKPVERVMACWPFHLPMQTQELQSARMEYSSGLRTATATPRTTPEPQAQAARSSDAVALIAATLREVSVPLGAARRRSRPTKRCWFPSAGNSSVTLFAKGWYSPRPLA